MNYYSITAVFDETLRVAEMVAMLGQVRRATRHMARKRPGAILADKVAVEIAIPEPSRDLYEVKVTFCDGVTLDTEVLAAHTDVHVEMLADVARWVS